MRKIISLFIILSSFPISAITQENNTTDNIFNTLKKVTMLMDKYNNKSLKDYNPQMYNWIMND
jgi:hypothetical protein